MFLKSSFAATIGAFTLPFLISFQAQAAETNVKPEDVINEISAELLCRTFTTFSIKSPELEGFCEEFDALNTQKQEAVSACFEIGREERLDKLEEELDKMRGFTPPAIKAEFQEEVLQETSKEAKCLTGVGSIFKKHLIDLVAKHGIQYGGALEFKPFK